MKWFEWVAIALLIMGGLACLTMSATAFVNTGSLYYFLHICLWITIPLMLIGLIYIIKKWLG